MQPIRSCRQHSQLRPVIWNTFSRFVTQLRRRGDVLSEGAAAGGQPEPHTPEADGGAGLHHRSPDRLSPNRGQLRSSAVSETTRYTPNSRNRLIFFFFFYKLFLLLLCVKAPVKRTLWVVQPCRFCFSPSLLRSCQATTCVSAATLLADLRCSTSGSKPRMRGATVSLYIKDNRIWEFNLPFVFVFCPFFFFFLHLQVPNSISPDLMISPVSVKDAGFYICRVNCGDAFEFSKWAQVDVLNADSCCGTCVTISHSFFNPPPPPMKVMGPLMSLAHQGRVTILQRVDWSWWSSLSRSGWMSGKTCSSSAELWDDRSLTTSGTEMESHFPTPQRGNWRWGGCCFYFLMVSVKKPCSSRQP